MSDNLQSRVHAALSSLCDPEASQALAAPIQSAEVAELRRPKVRYMWSSLFTNMATGIQFALSTGKRGDLDVMAAELLESPEIDTAKVYEVAVLKRAEYDALAATPAQPAAVSAPTDDIKTDGGNIRWMRDGALVVDRPFYGAEKVLLEQRDAANTRALHQVDEWNEVYRNHQALVRELDVLLNGNAGAAKQASLCDIVAQVRGWQPARAAAPVSGQGASIDTPEFRDLAQAWSDAATECHPSLTLECWNKLVQAIDARQPVAAPSDLTNRFNQVWNDALTEAVKAVESHKIGYADDDKDLDIVADSIRALKSAAPVAQGEALTDAIEQAEQIQSARKTISELFMTAEAFMAIYDEGNAPDSAQEKEFRDKIDAAHGWLIADVRRIPARRAILAKRAGSGDRE